MEHYATITSQATKIDEAKDQTFKFQAIEQSSEITTDKYQIETETVSLILAGDDYNERLVSAAHNGDLENVKIALANGANINFVSNRHCEQSAIQCASLWGHYEVVEYLVSKGVDIYARQDHALRLAKYAKNQKIVNFLMELGSELPAIEDWHI